MVRKFVAAVALALWSAFLAVSFAGGPPARADAQEKRHAEAPLAKQAAFHFTPHQEPRQLPEIWFEDGEGRKLALADFGGKVVLLNVWATWCPPCRKEMPSLDRLQARLGGRDFEVLPLSIDRGGIFVVKDFYEEMDLKTLRMAVDKTANSAGYLKVFALPTTLLIDRRGREIGRVVGPAEWDSPPALAVIRHHIEAK